MPVVDGGGGTAGVRPDLTGRCAAEAVLVRGLSPLGYSRASYELNLGCNWDCEHCYLGLKQFRRAGMGSAHGLAMLHAVRDAGVVYLQLTGGEPLIDRLFCETYELAWRLGMMLSVSTNGSRLHNPRILELLAACPPYRITVSAYGATEASYDALVRLPGAFRLFSRGMAAALEAGLPLRMNIVLTKTNAHEQDAMIAMAERWGLRYLVYQPLPHDLRRRRGTARAVGRAPEGPQAVHRLQRRAHVLPRRPARPREHLQGRS